MFYLGRTIGELLVHIVCVSEVEESPGTFGVLQGGYDLQLCYTFVLVLCHPGVALRKKVVSICKSGDNRSKSDRMDDKNGEWTNKSHELFSRLMTLGDQFS